MMRSASLTLVGAVILLGTAACDLHQKRSLQNGYRGTGMDTIRDNLKAAAADVPAPPYAPPAPGGAPASSQYQNLQVLGDVSADELSYTMAAMTQWIAPKEGCNYCHNPANMASDEKYTKVVARRMLQMTRAINQKWSTHVGKVGVTCYTCHRGQYIPSEHWSLPADDPKSIVGNRHGQDNPTSNSAYSSLPNIAVAEYLTGLKTPRDIRVVSKTEHPTAADQVSVMKTEDTYALMMHITSALGVNCTYCHNAQSFQQWSTSNPPRATAWYGIRMVRDINGAYITTLANVFPANRKGERGDPYKVNCTTCHRGLNKPLGGVAMSKDYRALTHGAYDQVTVPKLAPVPAAAPVPVTPPPAPPPSKSAAIKQAAGH
ncbi:photosynthetic reaction center cytochrome PufC [Sphingomonas sp. ASV193]|uniref:photosynthetic reaction center cytochrome PufC n=1 Tax=Sphingomonas sp. ASV193 TaxID=3144405 RepID=UPI0032E91192